MQIKRRYTRWQLNRDAWLELEGKDPRLHCIVNDISFLGVSLTLVDKLPEDAYIKLKLVFSGEMSIEVEAWVVWHRPVDGHYYYGLYFTKIRDQDKEEIYQYMRRHFPEKHRTQWWDGLDQKKGGENMEDRRIFQRFNVRLPMRFLNLLSGKEGEARAVDFSAKGIGLVAKEELKPKTPVEMWIDISQGQEPQYCRGEVVWSQPEGGGAFRAGVNLDKADLMGLGRVLRAI